MATINVENLTFSYPSDACNVFENVSFQIDTDWKLGFIGRNGRGKTTFLKLLQGEYEYGGKIISPVEFDYFPYPVKNKKLPAEDVLYGICPSAEEWRLLRELSLLNIDGEVLKRPFDTLSNGERTKILLAALFLNEGRFLLIDEPTNHLDTQARQILSAYLKRQKSYILVSHDRNFLDGCIDHVLSLNRKNIEVQSGNFSAFMQNYDRRQEYEQRLYARLQADVDRLQKSVNQTSDWASRIEATKYGVKNSGLRPDRGYIGHKSAKMMKRAKNAEARRQREIEEKSALLKNTEQESKLKLYPLTYRSEKLISLVSAVPLYGEKKACKPVTFEIKNGGRIALDGKNGCGKSSLLKLICGINKAHSGELYAGSNLIISYVPQDTSDLSGLLSDFAFKNAIDESLFKAVLHKTGFDKDLFSKDISRFSDGQKKKILIAKSLCEKAHLYVWDEPLNFIDVFSRIQIENLIEEFKPTMVFVEHDSAFRDKIATEVVKISGFSD